MSFILIQHIHTLWNKRSRGGNGARLRNTIPYAFSLPSDCTRESAWILHQVTCSEINDFARTHHCIQAADFQDLGFRDLVMQLDNYQLQVRFYRNGNNAARSSPLPFADLPFLPLNHWLRLRYNGRYVQWTSGNWWYEQSCYNIGYFESFTEDVFLKTTPASQFVETAQLH